MRIVIDARESGTSSGRYVDKLLEYLQKIDSENQYVLLLKNHRLSAYQNMPKNFRAFECNIKEFTFAEQTKLASILYKLKPDLVHFPFVQQPLLYFGKTVTTMQDLTTLRFRNPTKNRIIFWLKQRIYWFVNFIAPRKSKHVIAISEFTKQDVMKTMHYNKPDKFTVTLESADFIEFPAEPIKSLVGKQFISYVGRHQPHKNLQRLVEAHHILRKDHPDVVLAIVGKMDELSHRLIKKFQKKGYEGIEFTGFITDAQLKWLYQHTTCYVFPSLSEGFGLPGLEAMIHGAPVASSDATCLPEINGDGAIYFNPRDTKDMAAKISMVLSDKKLAYDLIYKGKKQASKYSWQRMAKQTLEVYKKVCS